jgi:hypothetical protein
MTQSFGVSKSGFPCLSNFPSEINFLRLIAQKYLFSQRSRAESPSPRVSLPIHDDSFSFSDDSVVATHDLSGGHLSDCDGNGLALGCDQHNFLVNLDFRVVPQDLNLTPPNLPPVSSTWRRSRWR